MNNRNRVLAIAGGGAAGMMAAVSALRILPGKEIAIIEKNQILGRKLAATGNGKCNFSNRDCSPEQYNENAGDLIKKVYRQMPSSGTTDLLEALGIFAREDSEGRLYPYSEQAIAVREAFESEFAVKGADCFLGDPIVMIEKLTDLFLIHLESGAAIGSKKLILATGGKAGSAYGADGSGYAIAKALGHSIVSPLPALVQLTVSDSEFKELKGVRAKGRVTLRESKKMIASEKGEIQFTESGLSGICVFDLSRHCRTGKAQGLFADIDLFPDFSETALMDKLIARRDFLAGRTAGEFLEGMLNKKLIRGYLKRWAVDTELPLSALSFAEIRSLTSVLKSWSVAIAGTKGWNDAQVTAGGVSVSEIDPQTLESKIVKGLYLAGELIDVDGSCGGRNLQWAFSSGFIAGRNAAMNDTNKR